jgi:general secretion pathway protein F
VRFHLKAIAPQGSVETVDLEAEDQASAVRSAERRGYTVLSVRAARAFGAARLRLIGERFPLVLFSQELRVLITAGVPLLEALDTLALKESREPFRRILQRLATVVREGRPFSAALEESPEAFPALYIAGVRASESTSELPSALSRYIAYAEQVESVRKRIVQASIYPALLAGVGAIVCLFLLLYVVPRFAHIYQERSAGLPFFSRVLLSWGQAVDQHAVLLLAAVSAVLVAAAYILSREPVRAHIGSLLWRLPALGERLRVYQLARFYRTTGMLLRAGMPLVTALDMAAGLLHPRLRTRLAGASRAIREGRGVSQSFDAAGLVTPVALRMLAVSERGGNMGEMLEQIAVFHDEELGRWVDWFTRLFEPLLMALIGLVIGVIVVLMYMPIFELAGNLQ